MGGREEKLLLEKRHQHGQHSLAFIAFRGSKKGEALQFHLFFQQKDFVNDLKPDRGVTNRVRHASCQQATRKSILLCIFAQGK